MRDDGRQDRMDTEEFAAMVAAPLKARVPLDAGFDARVMAQIAAEAATPWWRRRSIALSPLGGLALAAGFGALMVLGGVGLGRSFAAPDAAVVAPAPDTVHVVRFVFSAPGALESPHVLTVKLTVYDAVPHDEPHFIRGDSNGDRVVDLSDGVSILGFLFLGTGEPSCKDVADADDDGALTITDAIYLLSHLFLGGPQPPAPYPDAGIDPTDEDLFHCRG